MMKWFTGKMDKKQIITVKKALKMMELMCGLMMQESALLQTAQQVKRPVMEIHQTVLPVTTQISTTLRKVIVYSAKQLVDSSGMDKLVLNVLQGVCHVKAQKKTANPVT